MSTTSTEMTERTERFEETDRLDEQQILAEMKGRVVESYFYEITDKVTGKVIPGLSYAGVKWVATRMAEQNQPLSVEHIEVEDSPDGLTYRSKVMVQNLATKEKRWGGYEQPRMMKVHDRDASGRKVEGKLHDEPNPFAYALAVSKGQRNALRTFLPEPVILEMYREWKTNKAKPAAAATGPSQVSPEQAKAAKEKAVEAKVKPAEATGAKPAVTRATIESDLKDFGNEDVGIAEADGEIVVTANETLGSAGRDALRAIMKTYSTKTSVEDGRLTFRIKLG